jgi:uncharacterized RDD family membrane protein YckC
VDDAAMADGIGISGTPSATGSPAGWWSRVGAAAVDSVIMYGGLFVALAFAGVVSNAVLIVALIVGLMGVVLYAPLMLAFCGGQTLGKRAVGIRVELGDGGSIGLGLALGREVLIKALVFGVIPFIGFLNVLWPLWDGENRALHDLICGSRVVNA